MIKKKIFSVLTAIFLLSFLVANQAQAVCPVCTIAVGAGLGLCRWLGIDDVLSGIWIGALIVSMIGWTLSWLEKKQIRFKLRWLAVSALFYLIIILPLYFSGIIGHPFNTFWGVDKLVLGIIFGSLAFILAIWFNSFLKKKNQGKVFFPFQKVIIPILFLVITTIIFHYIVGCEFLNNH
jgi:hypothetical protein